MPILLAAEGSTPSAATYIFQNYRFYDQIRVSFVLTVSAKTEILEQQIKNSSFAGSTCVKLKKLEKMRRVLKLEKLEKLKKLETIPHAAATSLAGL